jgi:chloride channel 3/4/5
VATAKFVGDALDTKRIGSISDAYIRFHGYPLLDNRRDWLLFRQKAIPDEGVGERNIFQSVTVGEAMTPVSNLIVLPAFSSSPAPSSDSNPVAAYPHTVNSLLRLLKDNTYQGFPIVHSLDRMVLLGFIRRADLLWVLDRSRKRYSIPESAPCYFVVKPVNPAGSIAPSGGAQLDSLMALAIHSRASTSAFNALESEGQFRTYIDFSPWINTTPLTVAPVMSIDVTIDLFKKLGLRYIMVTKEGAGLVDAKLGGDLQPLTEIWPPPGSLIGKYR